MEESVQNWKKSEIRAHRRKINCLSWNCSGTRLATGSQETIKIWKTTEGEQPRLSCELGGHQDAVKYLRWHPTNPDRFASASSGEKSIRFWDARTSKNTATLSTPGSNLYLAWHPDGNNMAIANKDDVVCIVDVRTLKIVQKHAYRYQVNEICFLTLPAAKTTQHPSLLPPTTTATTRTPLTNENNNINNISSSSSSSEVVLLQCNEQGETELRKYPDMQRYRPSLRGHVGSVLSVAVDPHQKYIATGGIDSIVSVWSAGDGCCLRTHYHMDYPIRTLAFSYDSTYLAMAGEDNFVYVENVKTGKSLGGVPLRIYPETCAWHPKSHVLAYPVEAGYESFIAFSRRSEP